jgi:MFS family permease
VIRERLRPVPLVSAQALEAGKRALVWDAAWASVTGAWSGGVVLVAFALSLGADPMTIGILAAIPFAAQAAQLPTIYLVERWRQRKLIGVTTLTVARVIIILLALLPFIPTADLRVPLLVGAHLLIGVLGSIAACAINSWFHQLLPAASLGTFFGKRLLVASALSCGGTLAAGLFVDNPPYGRADFAYAIVFVGAGLAGLASCVCLARTPEPTMPVGGPPLPMIEMLREPLRDANFRRLLVMLGGWNLTSNLAAPFLTVYLIQQLGYGLGTVTALWVSSQLANAAALYLWGRLSDRLSNKAILAVALPVYFAAMLGLVFVGAGATGQTQLIMLYGLHVVMGAATGGIGLATGNIGLKLAPQGRGTPYLAAIGTVSALLGGVAPILGGAIAQWLSSSQLSVVVRWVSPTLSHEVSVLSFAHWEFLFALSALLGLFVLRALWRVSEGSDISERVVIQELALEAVRTVNQLSSIGGLIGSVFSFTRVAQWRPETWRSANRRRVDRRRVDRRSGDRRSGGEPSDDGRRGDGRDPDRRTE